MNKEKLEAKLFKKIDNTYVEITKEQLIISLQEANKTLEQENKQLKDKINQALHKLKSSVNHFKTQRENNAVTFTIKILGGNNE